MRQIKLAEPSFDGNEHAYLESCLRTGQISGSGSFVEGFEHRWAARCGAKYGVATSSGTAALHLALLAHGVGPGDEVIVPDLTFVATANAVRYCGATPLFADVDPETWNIQPQAVRQLTGRQTKVILPVHLYGNPADIGTLALNRPTYDGKPPALIDDAAQAHGAFYRNKAIGGLTAATCWSFHAAKIITTGEGGMVTTNDPKLATAMALLRDHGMDPHRRFWHPIVGYNYRMTNLQAAVGCAQAERFDELLERRHQVIRWYRERLADLPIQLPYDPEPWGTNVCWLFGIVLPEGCDRDRMMIGLEDAGVETRPFFYPLHTMPPYEDRFRGAFPVATRLSRQGLCLPCGPHLNETEVDLICNAVARLGEWR